MTRRLMLPLVLLAACSGGALRAQTLDTDRIDDVVQFFVANGTFSGSVLVAHGDEVLYHEAYGAADLEWDIPNTIDTRFRIGSLTKQFTAAAILLLEEAGQLSLDDPVGLHLPDTPKAWADITLYHLLTHTAGLPNFQVSLLEETTPEDLVRSFRDMPLRFAPGERYDYKNSGYHILGYLIERISHQSYAEFLEEHIFQPLGMHDTGLDSTRGLVPRLASGYRGAPGDPHRADYIHMSVPYSAGALYSTTGDLWRWYRGLFGGKLVSAASLEKMTTPFKDGYALGLQVIPAPGRRTITHAGGINGFLSRLTYFPETDTMLVVLANMMPAATDQIAAMVNRIIHGDPVVLTSGLPETTLAPDVLARFAGQYRPAPGVPPITIVFDGDQLIFQPPSGLNAPLFASSETEFFLKAAPVRLTFVTDDAGTVTGLSLGQPTGMSVMLSRSGDAPPMPTEADISTATLAELVGTYELNTFDVLRLTLEDGRLMARITGPKTVSSPDAFMIGEVPLYPESETAFFARLLDARLEIEPDERGELTRVVLYEGQLEPRRGEKR